MEVPSGQSPQARARRLGHRIAAGGLRLLRLAQKTATSVRAVLEQVRDLQWRQKGVLVGVLIGLLLSAVSYGVGSAWHAGRLEKRASTSKTWPVVSIRGDMTVEVTTQCRNSTLSYIVSIIPPPGASTLSLWDRTDQSKVVTDQIRERVMAIRLKFAGKEGVPPANYELPMDDFVRIYSTRADRPLTLEARGTLACDPRRYLREDTLELDWVERPGAPKSSHQPAERPEQEAG